MFQLTEKTPATITSYTSRKENHGEEKVPALSFGFEITVANSVLEMFEPGLTGVFYMAPDEPPEQGEIAEVKVVHLTRLRTAVLGAIEIPVAYEGWRLQVEFGIDDTSAIVVGQCKVDGFEVTELHEGGSIKLRFRVGSSALDDVAAGRLWKLQARKTNNIMLLAPERADDEPAQATNANEPPKAATRRAKPAADKQQSFPDAEPMTGGEKKTRPFPDNDAGASEAPPQSAVTEVVKGEPDATDILIAQHGLAAQATH